MKTATDYTAKELLENTQCQTYITTRGTLGDDDAILQMNDEIREQFTNGEVISINDLLFENEKAFFDIEKYLQNNESARMTAEQCAEYAVIHLDCQYLLVWCN